MSFSLRLSLLSSVLLLASLPAFAAGDAAAGQAKSAVCAACHGADGNSVVPNWPKLAGQHAQYMTRQVTLIKSGARVVPEMVGVVPGLTDQDIADLSAWFASQQSVGGVADEATLTWASASSGPAMRSPACPPACPATARPAKAIRWRSIRPWPGSTRSTPRTC